MERMARHHPAVSVLFADVVGFSELVQLVDPAGVMDFLNRLFTEFDNIYTSLREAEKLDIYKVETIGSTYMLAGGLTLNIKADGDESDTGGDDSDLPAARNTSETGDEESGGFVCANITSVPREVIEATSREAARAVVEFGRALCEAAGKC